MSKVMVFKGRVFLTGIPRGTEVPHPEPFYKEEIPVYGETAGELLDNLVETSVRIAEHLFVWMLENKSADYKMSDDFWFFTTVIPAFESHGSFEFSDEEYASGTTQNAVEGIVRSAALTRELTIERLHLYLSLRGVATDFKPAKPFDGIYDEPSLSGKTGYGFMGSDFEALKKMADEIEAPKTRASGPPKELWWKRGKRSNH